MRKNRNVLVLLLTVLLVMVLGGTAFAENAKKIVDQAGLLTAEVEQKLQEQMEAVAEQYQCDVAVVTVDSYDGRDIETYTDDYYYENGYGYGSELDGIMLLIAMEEREFHYATRGKAIQVFTDYGLEQIDEEVTPYLSDGDYYKAFQKFGSLAEEYLEAYKAGGRSHDSRGDYSYGSPHKNKMSLQMRLLIAAGVGLLAAVIVLAILFSQLRSVGVERQAREYVRQGSFHLSHSRDIFLYHTIHRRAKPKDNDGGHGGGGRGGSRTHRTSGGGRAGGRSGRF